MFLLQLLGYHFTLFVYKLSSSHISAVYASRFLSSRMLKYFKIPLITAINMAVYYLQHYSQVEEPNFVSHSYSNCSRRNKAWLDFHKPIRLHITAAFKKNFFGPAGWMDAIDWRGFGAPPPDISVWTKGSSLWVWSLLHRHYQCRNPRRTLLFKKVTKKKTSSMQFLSHPSPAGGFDISAVVILLALM